MSFKTITVMLLLRCLGATSTSLGVTEELPQNKARIASTITEIRWLRNETSTIIQICTANDLVDGRPQFVYNNDANSINIDGRVDVNTFCANFTNEDALKYTETPSTYELFLFDISDPNVFLLHASTTVAITVRTTLLTCATSLITKITWEETEQLLADISCLGGSSALDKVCYHNADLTETEFCFIVNDVNVCLNGPIDITASSEASVAVNYFYYGDGALTASPADATLSLVTEQADISSLRAIVRWTKDMEILGTQVYGCSNLECILTQYTRQFATCEVCVEIIDDNGLILTATTLFTDLNLNAFLGGSQVELAFANGLASKEYTANMYKTSPADELIATAKLDCTSVAAGHACFGFLDPNGETEPVRCAISDSNNLNTIIVPYEIPGPPLGIVH